MMNYTSESHSTQVKTCEVNWLPKPVKISGFPCRASTSSSDATQNQAAIVFDRRHDSTLRIHGIGSLSTTSISA